MLPLNYTQKNIFSLPHEKKENREIFVYLSASSRFLIVVAILSLSYIYVCAHITLYAIHISLHNMSMVHLNMIIIASQERTLRESEETKFVTIADCSREREKENMTHKYNV